MEILPVTTVCNYGTSETVDTRQCKKCGQVKPLTRDFFYPHYHQAGFVHTCKVCDIRTKTRYPYSATKEANYAWRHSPAGQHCLFMSRLKRYGLTLEQYQELLTTQDNKCAVCLKPFLADEVPVIDHNHDTQEPRGLLHRHCNAALGLFEDDPEILNQAMQYLEKYE